MISDSFIQRSLPDETLHQAWWDRISRARWFGGKGQDGKLHDLIDVACLASVPGLHVRLQLAEVRYPAAEPEFYQLWTCYRRPERTSVARDSALICLTGIEISDALDDPQALALVLDGDCWTWRHKPDIRDVRAVAFEQSNSMIGIGDRALVKVFRRVQCGPNPDLELNQTLADTDATPALLGWLQPCRHGQHFDAAMVTERLADAVDGWTLMTRAGPSGIDLESELLAMGRALAKVHLALAERLGCSVINGSLYAQRLIDRLELACATAAPLRPYADDLRARYRQLEDESIIVQRIHGDFHLGQVLKSPAGYHIIDFEGEPGQPLSVRRAPESRWRDVAGLLRSLDYARAVRDSTGTSTSRNWAQRLQQAFLAGYTADELPDPLVQALVLDRAVHEVAYELGNRPKWAQIPLEAVMIGLRTSSTR